MLIKGIQKTTLVDYPGKIACTVFLWGCDFACPFCQNKSLVKGLESLPTIGENELLDFLKKKAKYLEGIVISGGEPTIHKDLPSLLKRIKSETGIAVKLDTNGANPKMLELLLEEGLVDYIAMDIKSSPRKYCLAAGKNVDLEKIKKSAQIIMNGKIDYEFRTTVVPDFFTAEDALEIAQWLEGADLYILQQFIPSENCLDKDFSKKTPYPDSKLFEFQTIMKKHFKKTLVRNTQI